MLVLAFFLFAVTLFVSGSESDYLLRYQEFQRFKGLYNRSYSGKEEERRFKCFIMNMNRARDQNKKEPYAEFGMTPFSDYCSDNKKNLCGFIANMGVDKNPPFAKLVPESEVQKYLGSEIDWRKKGCVSSIKNQGDCGSCWAFSAVDATEGAWCANGGPIYSLSTQEVVDCTNQIMPGNCPGGHSTMGACQGGNMQAALKWIIANKGLDTNADYPYVSGINPSTEWCNFTKCKIDYAPITGYKQIASNEGQMLVALQKSVLSIAVDASSLLNYKGGIMTNCENDIPDHGVGIVGYGLDSSGKGYWIIKNSWGKSWGEDGYFRVAYGSNQCDITFFVNQAIA